jgi:hypothetical protein
MRAQREEAAAEKAARQRERVATLEQRRLEEGREAALRTAEAGEAFRQRQAGVERRHAEKSRAVRPVSSPPHGGPHARPRPTVMTTKTPRVAGAALRRRRSWRES